MYDQLMVLLLLHIGEFLQLKVLETPAIHVNKEYYTRGPMVIFTFFLFQLWILIILIPVLGRGSISVIF